MKAKSTLSYRPKQGDPDSRGSSASERAKAARRRERLDREGQLRYAILRADAIITGAVTIGARRVQTAAGISQVLHLGKEAAGAIQDALEAADDLRTDEHEDAEADNGYIVRRGPKDRPHFYVRYVDADGKRKQRAVKGATTRAEAQRVLNAAELRVAQGKVGIEEPTPEEHARKTITLRELEQRSRRSMRRPA